MGIPGMGLPRFYRYKTNMMDLPLREGIRKAKKEA